MLNLVDIGLNITHCSAIGVVSFPEISRYMSTDNIKKVGIYLETPRSVITMLFPYYINNLYGNLSKYARGFDYHIAIKTILGPVLEYLHKKYPNNIFINFTDVSPIPEVRAAHLSGIGALGKNGLIIDDKYGSFVFISTIVTDLEIIDLQVTPRFCCGCNICIKKCPGGAIGLDGAIDEDRCLSAITQSKNTLTEAQIDILNASHMIWGCDICSDVCPHNKNITITDNKFFTENLIYNLVPEDIINLSRREFNNKYPNRAFTYKGAGPFLKYKK